MQRHHKRHKGEGGINLVSMIDMLTVLVFFLLVYSTEAGRGAAELEGREAAGVDRRGSTVARAVVVIITEREIMINGQVGRIGSPTSWPAKSVIIPAAEGRARDSKTNGMLRQAACRKKRRSRTAK